MLLQTLGARGQIPLLAMPNETEREARYNATVESGGEPLQRYFNKTVPDRVSTAVAGTVYEDILAGEDGKYANGTDLEDLKKDDILGATRDLLLSELGDKTFLILFLFTLGWSNPDWSYSEKDPIPGYRVFADGHIEIHHRRTHVGTLRIFILSTLGTVILNWSMAHKTTAGAENRWVFESGLILVYCLLNYAYRLLSHHFSIVTKLET